MRKILSAVFVLCILLTGCGEVSFTVDSTQVWFTPLSTPSVEPEPVGERSDGSSRAETKPGYREIMDGFRNNADILIERSDIESRLPQIERVFIQSGQYLELLAIYRRLVDAHGLDNPAAHRLVWGYIRLGDPTRARTYLNRLHRLAPGPTVWFLEGSYWLQRLENGTSQAGAKAAAAWETLLGKAPDFSGFGNMSPPQIRKQLNRLKKRVSNDSVRQAKKWFEEQHSTEQTKQNGGSAQLQRVSKSSEPQQQEAPKLETKTSQESAKNTEDEGRDKQTETSEKSLKLELAKGRIAMSEGDYEEAKRIFERLLQRQPDNPRFEFELLKAQSRLDGDQSRIERKLDSLAEREGLSESLERDLSRFRQRSISSDDN